MKILIYADGRSAATKNWLRFWIKRGDEVHLVTSYLCEDIAGLASLRLVSVAFSSVKKDTSVSSKRKNRFWGSSLVKTRLMVRQWLGPLTVPAAGKALNEIANTIQPDLVHAMRIPYEGMVAGASRLSHPLVISVW